MKNILGFTRKIRKGRVTLNTHTFFIWPKVPSNSIVKGANRMQSAVTIFLRHDSRNKGMKHS